MNEFILMAHVVLGVLCLVATVWVFVDVLHASESNLVRIRRLSRGVALAMWIGFLVGGYWYVTRYAADKAIILNGPWPFAHNLVMETKEHLAIPMLLMATYLPIAAGNDLVRNKGARKLMLWVAGVIVVLALTMEGEGALIGMGGEDGLTGEIGTKVRYGK